MVQVPEEVPISRLEARELIAQNAGTVGLHWFHSFILISAIAIAGISLLTSIEPVSLSDYLALFILTVFVMLALSLLLIVHSKPVSFDRYGLSIGWFWGEKKLYDWDEVVELSNLSLVPGVAILKLSDHKRWPIFMDLDRARHLSDAILIWRSAQ